MHLHVVRRSLHTGLLAAWVGWASTAVPSVAGAAPAKAESSADYKDLMRRADAEHAAGSHAAAAELYAAAYRARPAEKRADQIGEITIESAILDYRLASEQAPEDLALLEARAQLLDEFLRARERLAPRELPPALVDELAQVRARIEERRAAMREPVEPAAPAPTPEPDPAPEPGSARARKVDASLLGVGIASLAAGGVLIGIGAYNAKEIDARATSWLAALDAVPAYTDAQRQEFREAVAAWKRDNRAVATGLVAGGAVLAVAGVGLTTWGAVRIVQRKRASSPRAARVAPALARGHVGVVLSLGF